MAVEWAIDATAADSKSAPASYTTQNAASRMNRPADDADQESPSTTAGLIVDACHRGGTLQTMTCAIAAQEVELRQEKRPTTPTSNNLQGVIIASINRILRRSYARQEAKLGRFDGAGADRGDL